MALAVVLSDRRSSSGRCCGLRRRIPLRRSRSLRAVVSCRQRTSVRTERLLARRVFQCSLWSSRSDDKEERAATAAAIFLARVGVSVCDNDHSAECLFAQPGIVDISGDGTSGELSVRRVRFTSDDAEVREIIPYEEVYGLHPREFVFGKNFCLIPAIGQFGFIGIGEESQDLDEEHEEHGDEASSSDDEDYFAS